MSDLQFLQSTVRGILLPTIRSGAIGDVTQSATQAVSTHSPASTIIEATGLTKQQTALIAIGVIGIPLICGTCLDEYLRKHRYFRCLRWLQKLKVLQYRKELMSIPNSKIISPTNSPTSSVATLTPNLENFPDPPSVIVSYSIENHPNLGPYDASSSHVLLLDTPESKRVKAYAVDPYGYMAQCFFDIIGDPLILPITNHTRTSVSTVTVRQVVCKNFPDASQVSITYYDRERCLGKFSLGEEHKLAKLKDSTREITARAMDGVGNVAETSFVVDQHSPMYISVFYQPQTRNFTSVAVIQQLQPEGSKVNNNGASDQVTELRENGKSDEQLKHQTSSAVTTAYRDII